jgi:hypothetical protein
MEAGKRPAPEDTYSHSYSIMGMVYGEWKHSMMMIGVRCNTEMMGNRSDGRVFNIQFIESTEYSEMLSQRLLYKSKDMQGNVREHTKFLTLLRKGKERKHFE